MNQTLGKHKLNKVLCKLPTYMLLAQVIMMASQNMVDLL